MMSEFKETIKRENITEVIGDEYKKWRYSDLIFINAPTGSGKTYFILHTLLPYIISENKGKILYLVNRRILKDQLLNDLKELEWQLIEKFGGIDIQNYIEVNTYQSIEEMIKSNPFNFNNYRRNFHQYAYVVYDECHYFDTDSIYNTNTQLSYEVLTHEFVNYVQIYISATIDDIKQKLLETSDEIYHESVNSESVRFPHRRILNYSVEGEYDYIRFHIFQNMEHLKEIILRELTLSKRKWLVFVDSIEAGQKLANSLVKKIEDGASEESSDEKDNIKDEDVVFIDARFRKKQNAAESVLELSQKNMISKKVIITTSVMDNGISFHDIDLRNIVITADTKEEFIQMLGRKRKDQEYVDLYLTRRTSQFFNKRYRSVQAVWETASKFAYNFVQIRWVNNFGSVTKLFDYISNNFMPYAQYQQELMEEIMKDINTYKNFKKFAFVFRGCFFANELSLERVLRLIPYYKKISDSLLEDPDAFLKLQLSWLGKTQNEIDNIINDCNMTEFEHCVVEIEKIVKGKLNIEMDESDNIAFKNEIEKECHCLTNTCDKDIVAGLIKRFDRIFKDKKCPISVPIFNELMEVVKLPYIMNKKRKGAYIISEDKNLHASVHESNQED